MGVRGDELGVEPDQVRRIQCRFRAMVLMPSTMTVRNWPPTLRDDGTRLVPFEVANQAGDPAVDAGVLLLGDPPEDA